MNDRQAAILEYIKQYQLKTGYCPSFREIANAVHLASISTVSYNLDCLERQGYIQRDEMVARGIRIMRGNP